MPGTESSPLNDQWKATPNPLRRPPQRGPHRGIKDGTMLHGSSELSRSCTDADRRTGMLARTTATTPLKPVFAAQPMLLSLRYPLAKAAQKRQFGTRYALRPTIAGPTISAVTCARRTIARLRSVAAGVLPQLCARPFRSEGAGWVFSPGDRGEEANFDPAPFVENRAAFGQFGGFGEVAGGDQCIAAER